MLNLCCYLYCASYLWFYFFLNILRPPRSNRLTHSFPTRRSSDLVEMRAVDEQAIFGRVDPAIARIGPRRGLGHGETGIEMQFARPAIVIERSEEHTSELQSLMRISYAVFCLKTKTQSNNRQLNNTKTLHVNMRYEDKTIHS